MKTKTKVIGCTVGAIVFLGLAGAVAVWKTKGPVLQSLAQDLKAGAMARHAPVPFDRFMEIRYGPMTETSNRERAFLSFFDATHIDGLHRLVTYMKPAEQQANIAATAKWIAHYRETLSPAEKESLRSMLASDSGQLRVKQATAKYLSQDAHYRAATAPVIAELMVTLDRVQKH